LDKSESMRCFDFKSLKRRYFQFTFFKIPSKTTKLMATLAWLCCIQPITSLKNTFCMNKSWNLRENWIPKNKLRLNWRATITKKSQCRSHRRITLNRIENCWNFCALSFCQSTQTVILIFEFKNTVDKQMAHTSLWWKF
jgi:hypothetical protein